MSGQLSTVEMVEAILAEQERRRRPPSLFGRPLVSARAAGSDAPDDPSTHDDVDDEIDAPETRESECSTGSNSGLLQVLNRALIGILKGPLIQVLNIEHRDTTGLAQRSPDGSLDTARAPLRRTRRWRSGLALVIPSPRTMTAASSSRSPSTS